MSEHQPVTLSKNGQPFPSEEAAAKEIKRLELDPLKFMVGRHEGGFAILDVEALAATVDAKKPAKSAAEDPMAGPYHIVEFQSRVDTNQPESVFLSVGGNGLLCMRGERTIIPQAYKEVADHAVISRFDSSGKVIGTLRKYIYTNHGEAKKEDFLQMLKLGNESRRQFLADLAARENKQPVTQAARAGV